MPMEPVRPMTTTLSPPPAPRLPLIGPNLRRDGAAYSSPPPCGEGLGVGVEPSGTARVPRHDPPPHPSPTRGEGAPRPKLAPNDPLPSPTLPSALAGKEGWRARGEGGGYPARLPFRLRKPKSLSSGSPRIVK